MVIRLYLGMLESSVTASSARMKIRETLDVVDRTIEGIRRIIGRLSPLVLQELGLIAAVRKEAKDLAKSAGVKARVTVSPSLAACPRRWRPPSIALCRRHCTTWQNMPTLPRSVLT